MRALSALHHHYFSLGPNLATGKWPPLVINTHGWVKGLGLDMLSEIIKSMDVTHILQVKQDWLPTCLPACLIAYQL